MNVFANSPSVTEAIREGIRSGVVCNADLSKLQRTQENFDGTCVCKAEMEIIISDHTVLLRTLLYG